MRYLIDLRASSQLQRSWLELRDDAELIDALRAELPGVEVQVGVERD